MKQLNNNDFKQHFVNILLKLGIRDYENKKIIVEPVYEKSKWTSQTYDEIMRLKMLPKRREMSFDESIRLLTFWEGYYPCWIKVNIMDDKIYLKTSLRMRKVNRSDDNAIYPFKADFE